MPLCACFGGGAARAEAYKEAAASSTAPSAPAKTPPAPAAAQPSPQPIPNPQHAPPAQPAQAPVPAALPQSLPTPAANNGQGSGALPQPSSESLQRAVQLQRKLSQLHGHWWQRLESSLDLLAKHYGAACASLWLLDDAQEGYVSLVSRGPLRLAVPAGSIVHLSSGFDDAPATSLALMHQSKSPIVHSTLSQRAGTRLAHSPLPSDWKLLHAAHHLTDFVAIPILAASPPSSAGQQGGPGGAPHDPTSSGSHNHAFGLVGLGMAAMGGPPIMVGSDEDATTTSSGNMAAALGGAPTRVVGAVTLFLSRDGGAAAGPEATQPVLASHLEQGMLSAAMGTALLGGGAEQARQISQIVQAVTCSPGCAEMSAGVAMGLQARLASMLHVAPAAVVVSLVPSGQSSHAIVFKEQGLAAVQRELMAQQGGANSMLLGGLASHRGQGNTSTAGQLREVGRDIMLAFGSNVGPSSNNNSDRPLPRVMAPSGMGASALGGSARDEPRRPSLQGGHMGSIGNVVGGGVNASGINGPTGLLERSPSLLGTGLNSPSGTGLGPGGGMGSGMLRGLNSRVTSLAHMPTGHSGLLSCKLDLGHERYKALVHPLSHSLLQLALQQLHTQLASSGGTQPPSQHDAAKGSSAGGQQQQQALAKLPSHSRSANAASSTSAGGPGTGPNALYANPHTGSYILPDCNELLHEPTSPNRDVYVLTRVLAKRPAALVLAAADVGTRAGALVAGSRTGSVTMGRSAAAGGGGGGAAGGGAAGGASLVETEGAGGAMGVYVVFSERLPRPLLEAALSELQLLLKELVAPLMAQRLESVLAEEWAMLCGAAVNQGSNQGANGAEVQHCRSGRLPSPLSMGNYPGSAQAYGSLGAQPGSSMSAVASALTAAGFDSSSPLFHRLASGVSWGTTVEGMPAGEALQQMCVLVDSYKDTLCNLQGSLLSDEKVVDAQRRQDLPHLHLLEVLGHGGGGVVFRGKLHALEVAVKVFEVPGDVPVAPGAAPPGGTAAGAGTTAAAAAAQGTSTGTAWPALGERRVLQRAALELAVTSVLSHPHMIQAYAIYTRTVLVKQRPPKPGTSGVQLLELPAAGAGPRMEEGIPCSALVMEYCDMGTLAHAIDQGRFLVPSMSSPGQRRPALKAICVTLLELALALRHLHSLQLAHCDLKPANVLLKSSRRDGRGFTTKLADFGYVSLLKASEPGAKPTILPDEACGTVTHMAPESFIKGQPLDTSVDVYAFGIIMWELYMCGRPYSDVPENQIAQRVTLKGLRPHFPAEAPAAYVSLARSCWSQDPKERPSAPELVTCLQAMLHSLSTASTALQGSSTQPAGASGALLATPGVAKATAGGGAQGSGPAAGPGGAGNAAGKVTAQLGAPAPKSAA